MWIERNEMRKWLRERLQRERFRFDRIVKINERTTLLETQSHASRTIEWRFVRRNIIFRIHYIKQYWQKWRLLIDALKDKYVK